MCACLNLDRASIALSNEMSTSQRTFISGKRKVLFTFSMGHETANSERGPVDDSEREDSAGSCY